MKPSDILLYVIEFPLAGSRFSFQLPAESWEAAEKVAAFVGGKVGGTLESDIPSVPAEAILDFLDGLHAEPKRWASNAAEQLQAFMSKWPVKPQELDSQ